MNIQMMFSSNLKIGAMTVGRTTILLIRPKLSIKTHGIQALIPQVNETPRIENEAKTSEGDKKMRKTKFVNPVVFWGHCHLANCRLTDCCSVKNLYQLSHPNQEWGSDQTSSLSATKPNIDLIS
jgi:hypothetical protein